MEKRRPSEEVCSASLKIETRLPEKLMMDLLVLGSVGTKGAGSDRWWRSLSLRSEADEGQIGKLSRW